MAMKRVCYEVKTSRADFLSELKRPYRMITVPAAFKNHVSGLGHIEQFRTFCERNGLIIWCG